MAFKVKLKSNPTLADFKLAKSDLYIQHLNQVAAAGDKDQWAFGQLIVPSARKVTAKFRNETCLSLHGEGCMTTAEMDALDAID